MRGASVSRMRLCRTSCRSKTYAQEPRSAGFLRDRSARLQSPQIPQNIVDLPDRLLDLVFCVVDARLYEVIREDAVKEIIRKAQKAADIEI